MNNLEWSCESPEHPSWESSCESSCESPWESPRESLHESPWCFFLNCRFCTNPIFHLHRFVMVYPRIDLVIPIGWLELISQDICIILEQAFFFFIWCCRFLQFRFQHSNFLVCLALIGCASEDSLGSLSSACFVFQTSIGQRLVWLLADGVHYFCLLINWLKVIFLFPSCWGW